MNTITTTLTTEAIFSDDGLNRYLLRKTWDESLPKLAIIMLAPSAASGIVLDSTTTLVLNNASRLGYGSVAIVNLFATLNDFSLAHAKDEDPENLKAILEVCQTADQIVYAPGTGKAKSKALQRRQEQVLNALRPFEPKLNCLTNADGKARLQHPLSPALKTWVLSPLSVSELIEDPKPTTPAPKKRSLPRVTKKECVA
jgi:hypothetical protein